MKKNIKKMTAMLSVVALSAGMFTACGKSEVKTAAAESLGQKTIVSEEVKSTSSAKIEKIYVIKDADGSTQKVIVNDWLKNGDASSSLSDITNLTNIKLTKGDGSFSQAGDKVTFDAKGYDVYYQGETDKETPVDVKISYELDGKKLGAADLKNVSGHLKMTFEYTNNTGKKTEGEDGHIIYQPYLMISGTYFDAARANNVTVSSGSVVNDGLRIICYGVGFPGLGESLGVDELVDKYNETAAEDDKLTFEVPEEVVIEADVTNFDAPVTLTVAKGDLLGLLDLDKIDTADALKEKLDTLTDGMNKLCEGADKLNGGLKELNTGKGKLEDGIKQLNSGSKELSKGLKDASAGSKTLYNGTVSLSDGAVALLNGIAQAKKGSDDLNNGTKQLYAGAVTLTNNNKNLVAGSENLAAGIKLLNDSLNGEASKKGITELVNGSKNLADGLAQMDGSLDMMMAGYSYGSGDVAALIAGLEATIAAGGLDPQSEYLVKQLIATYKSLYDNTASVSTATKTMSAGAKGLNQGIVTVAGSLNQAADGINSLYLGAGQLNQAIKVYTDGVDTLKNGIKQADEGAYKLSRGLNDLMAGAKKLDAGAKELKNGAYSLSDGLAKLDAGADKLSSGMNDLEAGMKTLSDGIEALLTGSSDLKDGLVKVNEEGISKISELVNNDLVKYTNRLKAIKEYSDQTGPFTGCAEGMDYESIYIFKTE